VGKTVDEEEGEGKEDAGITFYRERGGGELK